MKLGIMLPFFRAYSKGEFERIDQAISMGFSSVWLREWPAGIGSKGNKDHSSGHDPLIYASHIGNYIQKNLEWIGFAALRLDYRDPIVTARALVSAQYFSRFPLVVGFGAGAKKYESLIKIADDWKTVRKHIQMPINQDDFILPPNFIPPKMYLASANPELWKKIDYEADGWLTYRIDPRRIKSLADEIRKHNENIEITIALWMNIDENNPNTFKYIDNNAIFIGERRLLQFIRYWHALGVNNIIYQPPATPTENQMKIIARCVLETGITI